MDNNKLNSEEIRNKLGFTFGKTIKHFKRDLLTVDELEADPNKYLYSYICTAKDTTNCEEFVVYMALYDNPTSKVWIRPVNEFFAYVNKEKYPNAEQTFVFEDANYEMPNIRQILEELKK